MQTPTADFELRAVTDGFDYVIGCDEVGRGAIAGPVVACACVLKKEFFSQDYPWKKYVRDSKTLSEKKREEIAPLIIQQALGYGIGSVEPEVIDERNIHQATLVAMRLAVESLLKKLQGIDPLKIVILVDGRFPIGGLAHEQQAIIDGDAKVLSIAAASIIAKVHRDGVMRQLDVALPEYAFSQHKGYGTKSHFVAIIKHGLSSYHRKSFVEGYSSS